MTYDMHTAVWPLLITGALGYLLGVLSTALLFGLLRAARWVSSRCD